MNTLVFIAVLWLLSTPLGYAACRWSNRVMGLDKWTCLDRLGAIAVSLFFGPLTFFIAVLIVLIERLTESQWAKRNARW